MIIAIDVCLAKNNIIRLVIKIFVFLLSKEYKNNVRPKINIRSFTTVGTAIFNLEIYGFKFIKLKIIKDNLKSRFLDLHIKIRKILTSHKIIKTKNLYT